MEEPATTSIATEQVPEVQETIVAETTQQPQVEQTAQSSLGSLVIPFEYAKEEDDTKELSEIAEDPKSVKSFYAQYPHETLEAFNKITRFAREINTPIPSPEVVIIGKQGHGKSILLEALLGHSFNVLKGTKRPIVVNIVNNSDCDQPRITIKRDPLLREVDDVTIPFANLASEVEKRNGLAKEVSSQPITIKYECKHLGNFTLIDTPGLRFDVSTQDKEEREKIALELAKPPNRTILGVEEANEWESIELLEVIKRIDAKFTRSVLVLTKFHLHLEKFNNPRDFAAYFSKKPPEARCFFTSVFSQVTRDSTVGNDSTFQSRVWQSWKRDWNLLDTLKFDKRKNEGMVGINNLRNHLLELAWKSFKDIIPELRKQLAQSKKVAQDNLQRTQELYSGLDYYRLRSIMSNFVADWLQVIVQLIDGSTEGNLAVNGQSLEEEDNADEGEWINHRGEVISPAILNVKHADSKVYGGHQFERLLNLFKAVISLPQTTEVVAQDLEEASALAIQSKANQYQRSWIASHIAQKRCQALFTPLISMLCKRGAYIMKRLADVGLSVLDGRRENRRLMARPAGDEIRKLNGYSYFVGVCRDIFHNYVDKVAQVCMEKCLDEVVCSQLIYWELGKGNLLDEFNSVEDLTKHLLIDMMDTIQSNILLKAHNYFLFVMPRDLAGEILKEVSSFDDKMMEDMFDLEKSREQLKLEEDAEKQVINAFQQKEIELRDQSAQFARFKLNS